MSVAQKEELAVAPRPLRSMCFCGPPNVGKKTALFAHLLRYFDGDERELRRQTMVVNCIVDPPGPDFVCSVLSPFASFACAGARLRAMVFLYADHLGVDAQTALRRCMELHSSTTRFFLVMYDDGQLIAPIRSRLRARRFNGSSSSSSILTAATVDDPIEALERDLCVRQATWSGLGHMFAD
jgi:DNA polymerase III delta prime subunit